MDESEIQSVVAKLTAGTKAVFPFSWELEFPEVFERENPGFDAIVGNPPFLGGKRISAILGDEYRDWLALVHPETNSNADIVAHFFRRAFTLLKISGCLGLIATNTIAQGDTRSTGLKWICKNGGVIYNAKKHLKWPGLAAVIVSLINLQKGFYKGKFILGTQEVPSISAFLFHSGSSDDPEKLLANQDKSFIGSYILGAGFTFEDDNLEATPIAEMNRLIQCNPKNTEVIFPYIGGAEVNRSPTHTHHRYVINFGDMAEDEARQRWPDLFSIVEEKVKPQREQLKREAYRTKWWQFGEKQLALYRAIKGLDKVLMHPNLSSHLAFVFLPSSTIIAAPHNVFVFDTYSAYSVLQSRLHEVWARFFSSSLKDDLRYTPTDCFETFPFPSDWETNSTLEVTGKTYYEFRADLMIRHNEGLTTTYNRFHDPDATNPDILKLRELHAQMDRAVLDAYGWTDIPTDCEFLLDYEDEDDEGTSKRKKPWRYRWPEEVHDEVLARLLKLNQERAEAEKLGRTPRRKVSAKTPATREPAPAFDDLPLFNNSEGATNS